jgi:hypothetical protein
VTDYILDLAGSPRVCLSVMMNQHLNLSALPDSADSQLGMLQHVVFCLGNDPIPQPVIGHGSESGGRLVRCPEEAVEGAAKLQFSAPMLLLPTQSHPVPAQTNTGS